MAKKFAGFTPEQLGRIDPELEGKQADEQNAIIRANPASAARVGKMTMLAQNKINQSMGTVGMAVGGTSAGANITRKSIEDPTSLAKAAVATPDQAAIDAGKIADGTGQVTTPAPQAQATQAQPAAAASRTCYTCSTDASFPSRASNATTVIWCTSGTGSSKSRCTGTGSYC